MTDMVFIAVVLCFRPKMLEPPSPSVGDTVTFVDGSTAGLSLNDVTIARNGVLKINGITSNLSVDQDGAAFTLLYTGSNRGWVYDKVTV